MFQYCYHLCTTALRNSVLCRDNEDYIRLWNCIVIYAIKYDLKLFCLCLMSNHFHILLQASPDRIESFFRMIKIQYGRYMKRKYGTSSSIGLEYKLFAVSSRKAFCQEVAYILRNAYKARISNPFSYPWCSAMVYFTRVQRVGRRVGDMSERKILAVLKTKEKLPEDIIVSLYGMILPESFIGVDFVEKMFGGSPVMFFDFLKKWNLEDIVDGMHGEVVSEAYSDDDVIVGIRDFCREDFGGQDPRGMDQKALGRLTRKIFSRFGASRAQLLRLLPVDDFLLDRVL